MTPTPMFAHSSAFLIWIFFVVYITSVVTFCFLMSVLFKKSTTAGTIGTLMFFLAIFPYNSFGVHFHSFPYILKAIFCMLVNTNMGQAMSMILGMESNEQGIQFSTLFHRDINTRFSFGELLLFMIVGCIVHLLLTFYIERVFPGEYGIAEPFYYPLMPFFNFLKKRMGYRTLANEAILQERKISNSDIEDEPENLNIGIKISNMSKKFGNKFAVNKLNLNMFEDQITVLLGHNGAGKLKTMII
jgi:ATP-binding cassette, subfamily A (ABC1), member 3